MAQAGQLQFGVDETYLSNSVSRALIKGVNEAKRSGGALTPNINEQAWRMPLGRITGDVDKFKSSLNAANQRVIAFSASASVFYGISTALKGLVTSTISVNKNMTDLNAIFKLSAADLNKFKNELFDVARSTSQSIDIVAKSSIEFSRQGLGVQETLKRTRDALILTRLTGLDAAEAANTLTAAVNSFNKSGLNTTEILNKMVAADSAFAVSSKDIADALVRVGSSAQDAGVQFNELIALVTTTKQVTGRDGAVIGNALKTLLARQDRGTVIETLEKLGVSVRDASNNVLPYITVLKNLAKQYDTLGISQKQQVSQLLGGVYQSNILKALMGDLAKSNSIYEQSLNAVGKAQDEAIKRNEYLNSSLATTIESLKTSFTQISANLGENVINKNIKSIGSGINTIFGKEFSDSFVNGLKGIDSEGAGNFIGQGLIKGISNVFGVSGGIPGAGLLAIGATLFKVLSSTLGTALKDMQSLLAFNEKTLAIQQGIDKAILGANSAEQNRLITAKTLAEQEQVILDILLRQKAAMQTMAAEKNALRVDIISNNPRLAKEAYRAGKGIPTGASGILPAIAQESHAISRGVGGASPSAKPVVVPNFNFGGGKTGPIVANTDEYLVKNYAGGGSAIFNKQMIGQMGLPRGAVKIAADGHIPNFANLFYRGVGRFPKSTFNDPFSLSDTKASLFASRDLEEAKSYGFNIGQFSLKRGLKGLNLYSPKGIEILNSVLKKEFGFSDDNLNLGTFKNIESKQLWKKVRRNTIYPALDNNYVNDALRKAGYDFISFPDKGNIDQYGSYETKKNISILNQSALINKSLLSAASGFTPFGISNEFGQIESQIFSKDKLAYITWIKSLKQGGSKELYNEFFNSMPDLGVNTVKGDFIPQQNIKFLRNKSIPFKSIIPQIIRGRYGKSSDIGFLNDSGDLLAQVLFGGGNQFDKDFSRQEKLLRNLLTDNTLTPTTFTTHLAGGHIPNFARRGRPSIKGRQIRYEGPMDFSSILGPEGLLELFTIFGFGLGDHPSKSTIDAKTLQKFGINIPSGLTPGSKFPYRNYAAGGIPNSVAKAIDRELKAGAPLSSIYIDSDPRLISPKNPRGILVANRRDEPAGGFEGVNRYKELGLDPKAAGAAHVPNFADPRDLLYKYTPFSTSQDVTGYSSAEFGKTINQLLENINLKDVDFLSGPQNVSKTLQDKIKKSVQQAFSGVDFGKTSAFSKLSDEVLLGRKKEIDGLIRLQTAQKQADIANQKYIENQKKLGLINLREKTFGQGYQPSRSDTYTYGIGYNKDYNPQNEYSQRKADLIAQQQILLQARESNETTKKLSKQVFANQLQSKLESGVKFGKLSGREQELLLNQFTNQAINELGFKKLGSRKDILANQGAANQIDEYVKKQIAQISDSPTFAKTPSRFAKWSNRINSAALPLAFGAPMLAGFIPEGKGGTAAGRTAGGFSGALQGVGTGAAIGMSFGPYGAAIGAAVGAIAGAISGVASKWNKSFEEIGRDIETANAKNQQVISNIQLYVQQADQVTELIKSGASQKRIKELIDSQVKLFSSFDNPEIRRLIQSGDISGASSIATQQQQKSALSGNIVSAISRSVGDASGFSRFATGKGGYLISPAAKLLAGNYFERPDAIGAVSSKNLQSIAKTLVESSDGIKTESQLRDFLTSAEKDNVNALKEFSDALGLTIETIGAFKELRPNEMKDVLNYFKTFKTQQIAISGEATPAIYEQQKRFQISQAEWQKASLGINLQASNMRIRGESGIRQQGLIQGALLDLNPNITDIERVSRSGKIQESALRQSNALNLSVQALQAQGQIAGLSSAAKGTYKLEDLMKSIDLFADVGKTGNVSKIQEAINQLSQNYQDSINTLESSSKEQKDSNDEQSQMTKQQLDILREQLIKWNELIESNKAQEQELKLSNSINVIRAKEQQRQSFLNQSTFSSDTFAQARRASEAAGGSIFSRGKYQRGNRFQAILAEQDLYSGMGIAQTEESLTYSNEVKNLRSRETLSRLLSDKLGKNIGSSETDLTSAAKALQSSGLQSNQVLGGRVLETLDLQKFDYQTAIKDLTKESGFSQESLAKIMQATGADPVQNIIASNTGATKDNLNDIRSLMKDYFASRERFESVVGARKNIADSQIKLSNIEEEKRKLYESSLDTLAAKPNIRRAYGYGSMQERSSLLDEQIRQNIIEYSKNDRITGSQLRANLIDPKMIGMAAREGLSEKDYTTKVDNIIQGLATKFSNIDQTKLQQLNEQYATASEELNKFNRQLKETLNPKPTINNGSNVPPVGASVPSIGISSANANISTKPEENIKRQTIAVKEQDEAVKGLSDTWSGFKDGLDIATQKIMSFKEMGEKAGQSIADSFGTAFGEIVTGSMSGMNAFRSFASSVIADIAKMYAQQAMKGLISSIIPSGKNTGGAITKNMGGSILKFASGGSVPALLTGGEFYYTPSQARSIGQNTLHAINSGTAKFARGGLVSGGSGYMDDVPAMLDNGGFVIKRSAVQKYGASKLSDIGGGVAMFASGGNVAPVSTSGGGSGNGNTSVKIDIHDNRTSASADSDQSTNDPEFNKRLSLAVKTKVLQVIQEQRRIGGVLRQGKNY